MAEAIPRSELPLNTDGSAYHIALKSDDLAPNVILVGDPERVNVLAAYMDNIDVERRHREFYSVRGEYGSARVLVMGTGIGVDNIEIALVELYALWSMAHTRYPHKPEMGGLNIIRVGTSGSPQSDVDVGTLAITDMALGLDNMASFYSIDYSDEEREVMAIAREAFSGSNLTPYCVSSENSIRGRLVEAAEANGEVRYVEGITLTAPGFYAPQGRVFGAIAPAITGVVDKVSRMRFDLGSRRLRVENIEMESSALNLLSRMFGFRSCTICAILASRKRGSFIDPEGYTKAVKSAAEVALDAIEALSHGATRGG